MRLIRGLLIPVLAGLGLITISGCAQPTSYDPVVRGGMVLDGGKPNAATSP